MKRHLLLLALGAVLVLGAYFFPHRSTPAAPAVPVLADSPRAIPVAEIPVEVDCELELVEVPVSPITEPESIPATTSQSDARLAWLSRQQNEDGSWGTGPAFVGRLEIDRPGITGLALLAFMDRCYTHLSQDEHEGIRFGDVVKNGLKWLLANQADDGSFPAGGDPALNDLLATWAVSEAYAMSRSLFGDSARRGVEALEQKHGERGLFDDDGRAGWAGLALRSAVDSELLGETQNLVSRGREMLQSAITSKNRFAAAAGWAALTSKYTNAELNPLAGRVSLAFADAPQSSILGDYFAAQVLAKSEGSDGSRWRPQCTRLLSAVWKSWDAGDIQDHPDRTGAVVEMSLRELAVGVAYRYYPPCDCCKR